MSDVLYRFSFNAVKLDGQLGACVLTIWLLVLGCTVSSILNQPFSKKQRTFWLLVVICVPLIGLLWYLPFSIRKENYPGLFNTRKK